MKKYLITIFCVINLNLTQATNTFVVNSPLHPWYANGGKDLIVNFSKTSFDERLVKEVRKHPEVKYPFVNISGKLDYILMANKQTNSKDVSFASKILTSKLHVTSAVNPNVIGHFAFSFKLDEISRTRVDLDRAFITFDTKRYTGNIKTYITIGELFKPFGTHSTNQLSEPITSVGKIKGKIAKIGFEVAKLSGATYIDSKGSAGVDFNLSHKMNKMATKIGISYMSKQSHPFAKTNNSKSASNTIIKHVLMPFISLEYNNLGIRGELLTATTKKEIKEPMLAARAEGFYSFVCNGKFYSGAIGYERKINKKLNPKQPKYRINATFNTVFLPFMFASFEIKYESDYKNTKSLGAGIRVGGAF